MYLFPALSDAFKMETEQSPIAVEEQSWFEGEDKRDPVEHNSRSANV